MLTGSGWRRSGQGGRSVSGKGVHEGGPNKKDLVSCRSGKFSMSGDVSPKDLRFEEFFLDL